MMILHILYCTCFLVIGVTIGWIVKQLKDGKQNAYDLHQIEKLKRFFEIEDIWLQLFEEDRRISSFFKEHNIKTIAVYGVGKLGIHLIEQIQQQGFQVEYIIDNRNIGYKSIKKYTIKDELPSVDIIIVTPVLEYKSIRADLRKKLVCEIVSIEDVIYETLE